VVPILPRRNSAQNCAQPHIFARCARVLGQSFCESPSFFDCFFIRADPIGQVHALSVRHPNWLSENPPCDLQHRQELPGAFTVMLHSKRLRSTMVLSGWLRDHDEAGHFPLIQLVVRSTRNHAVRHGV
jgi:hypothetical protein